MDNSFEHRMNSFEEYPPREYKPSKELKQSDPRPIPVAVPANKRLSSGNLSPKMTRDLDEYDDSRLLGRGSGFRIPFNHPEIQGSPPKFSHITKMKQHRNQTAIPKTGTGVPHNLKSSYGKPSYSRKGYHHLGASNLVENQEKVYFRSTTPDSIHDSWHPDYFTPPTYDGDGYSRFSGRKWLPRIRIKK